MGGMSPIHWVIVLAVVLLVLSVPLFEIVAEAPSDRALVPKSRVFPDVTVNVPLTVGDAPKITVFEVPDALRLRLLRMVDEVGISTPVVTAFEAELV